MIKNVLLIFGGISGEHDVSCISAAFIEKTLRQCGFDVFPVYIDKNGNWHKQDSVSSLPEITTADFCSLVKKETSYLEFTGGKIAVDFIFPMIHGTTGEDGKLQGLMEFLDIPYAGAGVLSSALAMDKYYSKSFFQHAGIPQVSFIKFDKSDWLKDPGQAIDRIGREFQFPVFIKPSNMGSSVGVSRVKDPAGLKPALDLAFDYDDQVLCEQGIAVREIEVSILGNYPDYKVSVPGEIIPSHEFYSYEAKYLDKNGAQLAIPAAITPQQSGDIQRLAVEAFKAVKGDGFARIDFFIDKATDDIYLNEINTLPGFTPVSMFPMMWENSGVSPVELIKTIVNLGLAKYQRTKALKINHP